MKLLRRVLPSLVLLLSAQAWAEPTVSMDSVMGADFTPMPGQVLFPIQDPQLPAMAWDDWKSTQFMTGSSSTGGSVSVYQLNSGVQIFNSPTATLPNLGGDAGTGGTSSVKSLGGYHFLSSVLDAPTEFEGKRVIRCVLFVDQHQTNRAYAFEYNRPVRIPPLDVSGAVALSCLFVGDGALIPVRASALHNFRRQVDGSITVTYTTFE